MKLFVAIIITTFSLTCFSKGNIEVSLSPAGSFAIKTGKVKGEVVRNGDGFTAAKLSLSVRSFKTGIKLRDKHLKEKLEIKNYPKISLSKITAKSGNGIGTLKIKNIQKKVKFTYRFSDGKILAKLSVKLKDFAITGISYRGIGVENIVKVEVSL